MKNNFQVNHNKKINVTKLFYVLFLLSFTSSNFTFAQVVSGRYWQNNQSPSTFYWDNTLNNSKIDNGAGNWNLATKNWTATKGKNNQRWLQGKTAIFGGNPGVSNPGTVTLTTPIIAKEIRFYSVPVGNFTLTGSSITGRNEDLSIAVNSGLSPNIISNIIGNNAFTKNGLGELLLSGNNTYNGDTNINGGTLTANSANAIPPNSQINFAGGVLSHSVNNQVDFSAQFNPNGGQPISIDQNGQTLIYNSPIVGAGTSFTIQNSDISPRIEYLVVGGGGGGGLTGTNAGAGGGGAGGMLTGLNIYAPGSVLNVSVGTGGAGGNNPANGSNSVFDANTAIGGGKGANAANGGGSAGGSGGGNSGGPTNPAAGGAGTAGQGQRGGRGGTNGFLYQNGGGGGGAGALGTDGNSGNALGGNGGAGLVSSITGTAVTYAGGGGGGGGNNGGRGGAGGSGGGGAGGNSVGGWGGAGTANTGGGGGGGAGNGGRGGAGGSGVVILAYKNIYPDLIVSAGLVYTKSTVSRPGYKVYRFTSGAGTVTTQNVPTLPNITLTVNGVNTYTGGTTLNFGANVIAGNPQAFGMGIIIVNPNATLNKNGFVIPNPIINNGGVILP